MIMTFVAFVGTVSHITMGAEIFPLPMAVTIIACLIGAVTSAKFANKCDIIKLNRIIGAVLLLLGIFTVALKFIAQ